MSKLDTFQLPFVTNLKGLLHLILEKLLGAQKVFFVPHIPSSKPALLSHTDYVTIEKHQFQITLKGEFNRLLSFLKEIELLQAIAISDNIELAVKITI